MFMIMLGFSFFSASSLPTHILAEKKVKPSMIINIVTMPRRA